MGYSYMNTLIKTSNRGWDSNPGLSPQICHTNHYTITTNTYKSTSIEYFFQFLFTFNVRSNFMPTYIPAKLSTSSTTLDIIFVNKLWNVYVHYRPHTNKVIKRFHAKKQPLLIKSTQAENRTVDANGKWLWEVTCADTTYLYVIVNGCVNEKFVHTIHLSTSKWLQIITLFGSTKTKSVNAHKWSHSVKNELFFEYCSATGVQPVWQDVGIEGSQNRSKVVQKVFKACFT